LREQQYWDMIYKTTACFIQLPLLIAAIIMRVPPPRKIALARYGRFLGLAYQVRDDIIDLIGDPRITGKVKGSDFVEGKSRLPLIYYMKVSSPAQRSSMNALIRKKNRTKEDIDRAISLLLKSDAIRMAKSALARLCRKAAKEAGKCGGDLVTQQLIDVAGMLSLDN
jgi:geranylgeranyl pyrophosphate synthase